MRPLAPKSIRIVPLGGLGEIGMNCLAIEQQEDILVVDCGTAFPHDDLGLDVLHPDFSWLIERQDRVAGVFLTHGHEDHIGGLPYLLREMHVPVWGPPHALGLVQRRLDEHGFSTADVTLCTAEAGGRFDVGSFRVEPIRVAHSIVEATALKLTTAIGTVVHSGDFNFDPHPADGEPTDEARLAEAGDDGVQLLLSDSTNVDVDVDTGSERDVARALGAVIRAAEGRVFVALFASNVQRLISLGDIAAASGRKVCLLGRSVSMQVEIARRIGRLNWPSDRLVAPETARSMPPGSVLVLAGGTQGEANSAMARLARGAHSDLKIQPGDTVILSSRIIPGNDRAVYSMMSDALRLGARLHTRVTDRFIHTSGHASRPEQEKMLALVRPRAFLPVHGTLHHLHRHAELARNAGVQDVLVVENGTAVVLDEAGLHEDGPVPSGTVSIGAGFQPVSASVLKERAEMARYGCVVVTFGLDDRGRVAVRPGATAHGVPDAGPGRLRDLERLLARALAERRRHGTSDAVGEELRRVVRRFFDRGPGSRPVVLVQHVEANA